MHHAHNPPPLQLPQTGAHVRPRHRQGRGNLICRQWHRRKKQQRVNLRHGAVDSPPGAHFAPVQNKFLSYRRKRCFCSVCHFCCFSLYRTYRNDSRLSSSFSLLCSSKLGSCVGQCRRAFPNTCPFSSLFTHLHAPVPLPECCKRGLCTVEISSRTKPESLRNRSASRFR